MRPQARNRATCDAGRVCAAERKRETALCTLRAPIRRGTHLCKALASKGTGQGPACARHPCTLANVTSKRPPVTREALASKGTGLGFGSKDSRKAQQERSWNKRTKDSKIGFRCGHPAEAPGCLSFGAGEELEVLLWSKAGWWWGCHRGEPFRAGWMPSTFLKPAPPHEQPNAGNGASAADGSTSAAPPAALATTEIAPEAPAESCQLAEASDADDGQAEQEATEDWPPIPAARQAPQLPPLPPGPPPSQEAPVWPPLPPGPPPPPGAGTSAPELQEAINGEYDNTLFLSKGKAEGTSIASLLLLPLGGAEQRLR
ncbi:unnamed protein product [Prorocentrum cordatum]|uniref:SH3 domain-containing protein n=1 Tax=Prorocentrum cordatum TaxID=2364126 RepID=A0ABN9PKQ1_9DINO|nr:unnamed protein product [Polarella glacialis]